MADQYKYDYEKKKWIKVSSSTPSRGETNRNGRSSTTSTNKSGSTTKTSSSGAKTTTSGKTSTGSTSSPRTYSRGETSRSTTTSSTPKYNTYSQKTNSYSYSPKNSTTRYSSNSTTPSYTNRSGYTSGTKSTATGAESSFFDSVQKTWDEWRDYLQSISSKNQHEEPKVDRSNETEDQRMSRAYSASASHADLDKISMEDIIAGKEQLERAMYTPGAQKDFDFAKFQTGKMAQHTGKYRDNVYAGVDALNLTDEERKKWMADADLKAATAAQIDAMSRAYGGDMSALNGLTGKERGEVTRAGRLGAYNRAGEALQQLLPENQQIPAATAANAPVKLPENYDLDSYAEDRFEFLFGETRDGEPITNQERQAAKRRIEIATGVEDASTITDWSNVDFDPNAIKDAQTLNKGAKTYSDLWNMTGTYSDEDLENSLITIQDYQNGQLNKDNPLYLAPKVSDSEYDRALELVYAMTGVDMSDAASYEKNSEAARNIDAAMRQTAAEPLMQAMGVLADGETRTTKDYQEYLSAYAKQQAEIEREEQEAAALDQLMQDKWGGYSGGKYSPRERGWTGTYSDADLIYELVAAGDDEERRAEVIWSGTNAVGNDFALNRRFNAGYQFMTDAERGQFFDVWNEEGPERALEYLDDLSPKLLKAENKRKETSYTEFANQNPFAANAMARLGTMVSAAEYVPNLISNALTGQQFSDAGARFNQAVTSTTAQNIAAATPNMELFGRNVPAFLYQAGVSAADSGLLALSGNGPLATAVLSTSAANATLTNKLDEGAPMADALRDSAAVGLIEMLTEKYSVEALMSDPTSLLGYIGKNMATEAAEEMTSSVLNIAYDMAAYGDDSEVAQRYRQLVLEGYTSDEAYRQVIKEKTGETVESGLAGALSGGMGAGPRAVTTAVGDRSSGKNLQKNDAARSVLDFAQKMLPEGDIKALAQQQLDALDGKSRPVYNDKLNENNKFDVAKEETPKVSNAAIGRVFRELLASVDEHTRQILDGTMLRNVRDQLREMGVDDRRIAEAANRIVAGDGSATPEDYVAVATNDAAHAVTKSLTDQVSYVSDLNKQVGEFAEKAVKPPKTKNTEQPTKETPEEAPAAETAEDAFADEEFSDEEFAGEPMSESSVTSDGEEVSVVGAESVDADGELVFKVQTADGTEKTVKASGVTLGLNDSDAIVLARAAQEYGASAASMFNARTPGQDAEEYAAAFKKAVQYGADGMNKDTIASYDSVKTLNPNQLGIAYEIGRAERNMRSELNHKSMVEKMTANGPVKVGNVDISGVNVSGLNQHQRRSVVVLRNIAELLGINIKLMESVANEQGAYTTENGSWNPNTLTLSLDVHAGSNIASDTNYALMHTASHELTHAIFQFADTKVRDDYIDFVLGSLGQKMGDSAIEAKIEEYLGKAGVKNRDDAIEEIVAEASVEALSKMTEEDIQNLADENPRLARRIARKIYDWVSKMKAKIAKAFAGTEAKNDYAKMMNDQLDELAKKWNAALLNAVQNKNQIQRDARLEEAKRNDDGWIDDMTDADDVYEDEVGAQDSGEKTGRTKTFAESVEEMIAELDNDDHDSSEEPRRRWQPERFADTRRGRRAEHRDRINRKLGNPLDRSDNTMTRAERRAAIREKRANVSGERVYNSEAASNDVFDVAADSATKKQSNQNALPLENNHIDQRTPQSVRESDTTLFCSEVEEAQVGFAAAANMLLYDAENSVRGQKFFTGEGEVTGQARMTSPLLGKIKDSTGWTWDRIINSLRQFAAMETGDTMPKNTVTNREMELYLDEVLSKGYTTLDGQRVSPWGEYIEAKNGYQGNDGMTAPQSAYDGAIDFAEYAFADQFDEDGTKFSMRQPVERVKNLIAVHNIREDNLRKALDLGGFPMPSIAIAKNDIGHQNFGGISLVFGSDTIDPKANKRNKVYSADAWTPTFPQVEYEVDDKADTRIYNKLTELKRKVDPYFANDLSRMMYGVEDQLNRNGGEEGLVKRALENYGMKAAYLESIGEHANVEKKTVSEERKYTEHQIGIYKQIADLVGLENIRSMPMSEIYSKYGDAINDIYPGASNSKMRFQRVLVNVNEYFKSADTAPVQKEVDDPVATREAIDAKIDPNAYERWVRDMYSGIVRGSGVYNGKELFTPSGNRRSFAATHYPATVEGIAKAMYDAHGGKVKNISANHDAKSLRAVTAKTFKSIDEMHDNVGRLKARTQEEADALTSSLDKRLADLASVVLETKPRSRDTYESLMAHDHVVEILQEVAEKKYSAATIKTAYAGYGYNITGDTAKELKLLLDDISAMPVNIFEAKPERAVYFDEVKYAIVPDTMDADLRHRLEELVPDVREYTDGDEAQRLELLNAREDLKFSMRNPQTETPEFQKWFKGSKITLYDGKTPMVLYHQTNADFAEFDIGREGAGFQDNEMPTGIYMKDFPDTIKLGMDYESSRQMALYAAIKRPLRLLDRSDAKRYWMEHVDGYAELAAELDAVNTRYEAEYDEADAIIFEGDTEEIEERWDRETARVLEEWRAEERRISIAMKNLIDEYMHDSEFDGVILSRDQGTGGTVKTYVALNKTQVKSATGNSGMFDPEDANIYHQLRDPDQVSDRELLANAMDSAAETQAELDFVRRYRKQIEQLDQKQRELEQVGQEIIQARKDKARKSDIAVLQEKSRILRKQLDRMDGKLLEFEAGKPLQAVVKRQRAELQEKARERTRKLVEEVRKKDAAYREKLLTGLRDRKNESFARQKYLAEVKAGTDKLREMVTTPTNKKHVPEILRKPMAEFLDAFDFASKRQLEGGEPTKADRRMADAYDAMRKAIERMQKHQSGIDTTGAEYFSGYLDLPSSYIEEFDDIMKKVRVAIEASGRISDTPIHQMKSEDLHELAKLLRILHSSINKMNKTLANAKYATADAAAEDSMADLDEVKMGKERIKLFGKMVDFIDWKNATPYYAFERFGRGGKAIFESLMNGWDKLAFNAQKLVDFTKSVYKPSEVAEWERDVKDVKLSSGETVRMSAAQLMSIYCLAKRAQAVGHLMGGGIRVADIDGKRGKTISQTDNYTLNEEDLEAMRNLLNDRQREVADKLQADMVERGANWGNEVSMKRFGYKMFTEPNYFPVESDKNNMQEKDEEVQENSLLRLLNMSATKDLTKNASNAIVIRSIFDVYTAHMSDMAKYNALGLQILDAMKWLNYVERTDEVDKNGEKTGKIKTRSVRKSLENAYGAEARRYIVSFIRNLNGDVEAGLEDGIFNRMTSNYKIAAVGANLRVGMLQITSMPRAATVIDPKYLMAGLAKWNARRGKTSKQAIEKVGIAKWKSMGFYDTNISRNLRQMIKHDETAIDKVREGSMKLAEWGDAWTMGVLYGAVESELLHTEKKLAPGTEAWDKRVNERMREIIYRTQVVDSTMTRSHLMRQKGAISGALAFMSEPTLTLNMLNDAIFKVRMDARQGKKWNPATAKTVAKVMAVTATVNVFAAIVEALFSALRDDDEFEKFSEKYMTALLGDYSDAETFGDRLSAFMSGSFGSKLNLLDNIPVVSDIIDAAKSGAADQMWQAFAGEIGEGYRAMMKVMREGGSLADYYRAVYKLMGGTSKAVGLPVSNAMRDVVSVYNTIVAEPMGWRRLQTYENTNSEAAAALLEAQIAGDDRKTAKVRERIAAYNMDQAKIAQALAKQAEEAYAMGRIDRSEAEAYMTGDGGKRSRQVKEALLETDYEIETGLEYGNMKADFISGVLSESDARKYLKKYDGLRDKEIDEQIKKWQYEKSTGLSYGNMKRDYIDGELTDSEVKSYRMKYGGADEAAVEALLGEWQYEKDTGLLWEELKLDYADGVISESKLRDYLKVYGGQSEEEVDTTVLKYDYYTVYGTSEGYSKAWRIPHAYETGGDYGAYIDEAFQEYMYGGDKPSTWKQARNWLASSLAGYYKPRYLPIAGTPEGDILLEEILDVFVAAGWERDYQRKYIAEKWIED